MQYLFIITARGGSKGVPGKNIKPLGGKPLIHYSIDAARTVVPDEQICVSTDDPAIKAVVEDYGLAVPFLRPAALATDGAGSYEVLLHALDHYAQQDKTFDAVVLLQPTSPFRNGQHVQEAVALFSPDVDMVVSVQQAAANPYYACFEEGENGYLRKTLDHHFTQRQQIPKVYTYNGATYVINTQSLRQHDSFGGFSRIVKYEMDALHSQDIDTPLDWDICEFLLERYPALRTN